MMLRANPAMMDQGRDGQRSTPSPRKKCMDTQKGRLWKGQLPFNMASIGINSFDFWSVILTLKSLSTLTMFSRKSPTFHHPTDMNEPFFIAESRRFHITSCCFSAAVSTTVRQGLKTPSAPAALLTRLPSGGWFCLLRFSWRKVLSNARDHHLGFFKQEKHLVNNRCD